MSEVPLHLGSDAVAKGLGVALYLVQGVGNSCQINLCSNNEKRVDGFVRELTIAKPLYRHLR